VRHADASKAIVTMEHERGALLITIEDDGKGFLPGTTPRHGLHFGLQTMRERAEASGGTLEVQSSPGQGTRVIVRLPRERLP
jgi:signal transduction histidine kinase